jgi:hypothetical protein
MMRGLCFFLVAISCITHAETLLTEAKIQEVTARGFVLQVGTTQMTVEDSSSTRFWLGKAAGKRDSFKADQSVMVRLKSDSTPPVVREMADLPSWTWLERIRKEFLGALVTTHDGKTLTVKFDDGSSFSYRSTEKTKVRFTDGESKLSSMKEGMRVYVKGRLLSNLDTWLAEVVDRAPEVSPSKAPKKAKARVPAPPLPKTGTFEAAAVSYNASLKILDVIYGIETLHVTITRDTKWYVNDTKVPQPSNVNRGALLRVAFKRDRYGRIVATRIDTRV